MSKNRILEIDYTTPPTTNDVVTFDGDKWISTAGGGGGGAVDSINGQTGVVVLNADDIDDAVTTQKFVTAADLTTLSNTSGTNTGDQDLSGLIPYTGATSSIDLNAQTLSNVASLLVNETTPFDNSVSFEVNGKGGFWDGVQSAYFATGSEAAAITGQVNIDGFVSVGDTPNVSARLGVKQGSISAELIGGADVAGIFTDGVNTVEIGNGTNALDAVGNLDITGAINLANVTTNALIIGDIGGDARGVGSIDIQQSRTVSTQVASGQNSMTFGRNNSAISRNGIAIGESNTVNTSVYGFDPAQQQGIAIGRSNSVSGLGAYTSSYPIAIGRSNSVTSSSAMAIGKSCTASNTNATAIGSSATASGANTSAFGVSCLAQAASASSIGVNNNCEASASNGIAIGYFNIVSAANGFGIGNSCRSLASSAGALGASLVNSNSNSTMLGSSASFLLINAVGLSNLNNENPNESIHASGNILATNIATLGAEKLTNGTFTGSATGWTVGSFAYSSNAVTKTADGTSALTQTSAAMVTPLVIGETYLLQFTVAGLSAGNIVISCAGATLATISGFQNNSVSKTFKYIFKATSTASLSFAPSNTSRITTLDTVSLKKITGGDLIGLGSLYLGQDDTNRMQVSVSSAGQVGILVKGTERLRLEALGKMSAYQGAAALRGVVTTVVNRVDTVGNVGAGEDDLYSFSSPSSTFNQNGDCLEIMYSGSFAANANNKRIRMYFGAQNIFDTTALAFSGTTWMIKAWLFRVSTTTLRAVVEWTSPDVALATKQTYTAWAGNVLTTNAIKITGEATADNDVTATISTIKWIPVS